MKKLTVVLLFIFLGSYAEAQSAVTNAQLTNTKWYGIMNVPGARDVILDFGSDTLRLIGKDDGKSFEEMNYVIKSDVITVVKVSGESPCDIGFKANLRYTITNHQLSIKVIDAECNGWASAWPEAPFKQQ